ncbi:MATE family efflux transporter [uncultured Eubacterium sp.]|uniref:MATE family efflux transporter n=1 Tax=uncultured Eubacterium sp. TaxID=165185 RepID=UPI0025959D4B|nr:MATE family efflux transporter [uncultured Eubacterium sp.]
MMKTKTLTEGTPWKQILLFSIPIFWGNVFQLLYSLVDTKIVGSTLGTEALAAVGSVSTLHTLMTGFLNGLTLGFSLITAMCFGAKNRERLKKSFAAAISLGVLTTAILVVALMIFLHPVLNLLHVPQAQFEMAYAYISVLIVGLFATLFYNLCANTLRAIGDALTPLIFLIVATVSNIGLDYLFILGFQMGVQGAAYATVLAQLLSVVLCLIRIFRKFPILHIQKVDFRFDRELIAEMYKSGLSMGLMSCLVGIGTILLQSAINTLGTTVIVAHTAARKVFELVSLPNSVLGSAMATYCGQNYGARRFDRIRQGIRASLIIAAVWAVVVFLICHTIEGKLIQFVASTTNPDVIYWGSTYLKVDMSFIVICGVIVILRNSMQGFGDRVIPVFSSCIELAGKIIFAFVFAPMFAYWGIIWAEPVVWIAMVIPLIVKVVHVLKKEAF